MTSQPNTSETYDVVIVGGGIAGLTVAYQLGNQNVLLLEKEDMCGGRTLSTNIGPYVFNQGAQMIPGGETNVAKLADELGLTRTLIDKTKTSTYMKGKFVAGSSDFRFLLGLPIPLFEKLKMAFGIIRMRSRYSGVVDKSPRSDDQKMQELSEKTLVERMNIRHPEVKAFWDSVAKSSSTLGAAEVAAFQPVNTFLHHAADELHVVRDHLPSEVVAAHVHVGTVNPSAGIFHHRKRLRQDGRQLLLQLLVILDGCETFLPLLRLLAQGVRRGGLQLLLEPVDLPHACRELLDQPLVFIRKKFTQKTHHHFLTKAVDATACPLARQRFPLAKRLAKREGVFVGMPSGLP